jgi:hypothetical protein
LPDEHLSSETELAKVTKHPFRKSALSFGLKFDVNPEELSQKGSDFNQRIDEPMRPGWIIGQPFLLKEGEVGKILLGGLLGVEQPQKDLKALMEQFFEQPIVVDWFCFRLNVFCHFDLLS